MNSFISGEKKDKLTSFNQMININKRKTSKKEKGENFNRYNIMNVQDIV